MSDEKKKNQSSKGKHEPMEQRKPRRPAKNLQSDKREETKVSAPEKPQLPGPEFYKNLKRETDEIMKITEESSSKYKNKEIHSNWKKYEVPVDSYEEIEEQANMGDDYMKLIQTPFSAGGHFQFKHEKSWDSVVTSSQYDKYFEIDMDKLAIALSSIPFYKRNNLDASIFMQSEITTMNYRAMRFNNKYFNIKASTPTPEIQDKILSDVKECILEEKTINSNIHPQKPALVDSKDKIIDIEEITLKSSAEDTLKESVMVTKEKHEKSKDVDEIDDLLLEIENKNDSINIVFQTPISDCEKVEESKELQDQNKVEPKSNTILESPEELERWLDDFLDN